MLEDLKYYKEKRIDCRRSETGSFIKVIKEPKLTYFLIFLQSSFFMSYPIYSLLFGPSRFYVFALLIGLTNIILTFMMIRHIIASTNKIIRIEKEYITIYSKNDLANIFEKLPFNKTRFTSQKINPAEILRIKKDTVSIQVRGYFNRIILYLTDGTRIVLLEIKNDSAAEYFISALSRFYNILNR